MEVDGFKEQAQREAISLGGWKWDVKEKKEAQMKIEEPNNKRQIFKRSYSDNI